jgi:ATP-dependent Clp protease ATP-binding subunit ClpA
VVPKINVYLPDDLADAVREMGVPVSAICQRALEASVRRVTAIRQATLGDVTVDDTAGRMAHFTANARSAVGSGVRAADASGTAEVGTEHLLAGILAGTTNLAVTVLDSMEIERDALRQALARHGVTAAAAAAALPGAGEQTARGEQSPSLRFTGPAANALELAVTEAIGLGHNYVGCEHLLLGLVAESDGSAGEVLRSLGADYRPVRRAVSAALAGYTVISASKQARAQAAGQANQPGQPGGQMLTALREAVRREMQPFVERLDRLEQRLGPDVQEDVQHAEHDEQGGDGGASGER